jgi:hypothetical protein
LTPVATSELQAGKPNMSARKRVSRQDTKITASLPATKINSLLLTDLKFAHVKCSANKQRSIQVPQQRSAERDLKSKY